MTDGARPLILEVTTRLLYPAMLILAGWIVLRGHNHPGGGFIGGLVACSATSLLAVTRGAEVAVNRIPLRPMRLAALSLLVSLASGLVGMFKTGIYLDHVWVDLKLGPIEYQLGTPLFFDLGVFGVVWASLGGIAATIISIDEYGSEVDEIVMESERAEQPVEPRSSEHKGGTHPKDPAEPAERDGPIEPADSEGER